MKHMVTNIGDASVSTIDLTETGFGNYIETCIFFPGGSSEVVARYSNAEEAEAGHQAFANPDVISYVRSALSTQEWMRKEWEGAT